MILIKATGGGPGPQKQPKPIRKTPASSKRCRKPHQKTPPAAGVTIPRKSQPARNRTTRKTPNRATQKPSPCTPPREPPAQKPRNPAHTSPGRTSTNPVRGSEKSHSPRTPRTENRRKMSKIQYGRHPSAAPSPQSPQKAKPPNQIRRHPPKEGTYQAPEPPNGRPSQEGTQGQPPGTAIRSPARSAITGKSRPPKNYTPGHEQYSPTRSPTPSTAHRDPPNKPK